MKKVRLSEQAQEDLLEIWQYIATENAEAAERLLENFREKFLLLLDHPLIGRERNDMLIGLRSFVVGKYLIFYQPTDYGIEVLRVRHGATNLKGLFEI